MKRFAGLALTVCAAVQGSAANAEGKDAGCAILETKFYDLSWLEFKARARTAPERTLVELVGAMQDADKQELKRLSAPTSDEIFDTQSAAYFIQLGRQRPGPIVPVGVLAYYRFDNTGVFYVEFVSPDKKIASNAVVDMPFSLKDKGKPAFIIDKMSVVNGRDYRRLNDWHEWKKNKTPFVCQ